MRRRERGGVRYLFKLMGCRLGRGERRRGFALKHPLIHCKYTQRIFVSLYFYVHTISILPGLNIVCTDRDDPEHSGAHVHERERLHTYVRD